MFQNQLPQQNQDKEPDPELTKQFLIYQQLQLQLEDRRLQYEEMRLQQNGKLSEKSMDASTRLLRDAPAEKRKTIITYGAVASVILSMFLFFIVYCVTSGKEEFAKTFLSWLSHFLTIVIGFLLGRSTSRFGKKINRVEDGISDVEIIN